MENLSEANLAELLTLTKEVSETGAIRYRNKNNQLHRVHGPAIIYSDERRIWYQNGVLHRDGGPAINCANGDKLWYHRGISHREDGPAIEYSSGEKEWWINGKYVRSEPCRITNS